MIPNMFKNWTTLIPTAHQTAHDRLSLRDQCSVVPVPFQFSKHAKLPPDAAPSLAYSKFAARKKNLLGHHWSESLAKPSDWRVDGIDKCESGAKIGYNCRPLRKYMCVHFPWQHVVPTYELRAAAETTPDVDGIGHERWTGGSYRV